MKVFQSTSDFKSDKKTIVTLGTFDGVHLGHQKIINRLINNTLKGSLETVVLTFFQHPRNVLHFESTLKLLNTTDEKIKLLGEKGIDNLIIQDFNATFSDLSGEEFVKNILVDQLNIQKIIIGYDHRFGKNRGSDIYDLIYFGKKYHFDVEQISAEEIDDISVSSTKIRNAILDGNVTLANQYLGYKYCFSGKVVMGKQLGRTINFPTANIELHNTEKIIPKKGVYIVEGFWHNKTHQGMMNIGNRPTVNGENTTIEVYFLNLDANLYDMEITISVLEYLRDEIKFDSIEALRTQLESDKSEALLYFQKS